MIVVMNHKHVTLCAAQERAWRLTLSISLSFLQLAVICHRLNATVSPCLAFAWAAVASPSAGNTCALLSMVKHRSVPGCETDHMRSRFVSFSIKPGHALVFHTWPEVFKSILSKAVICPTPALCKRANYCDNSTSFIAAWVNILHSRFCRAEQKCVILS